MSSNAPRQRIRPAKSLPRFIQSSKPGQMHCRAMRDGRPLAQKWDEENCEPHLLLYRLCKALRGNDGIFSEESVNVSFLAEKQSHRPIRDGLRIASSFES